MFKGQSLQQNRSTRRCTFRPRKLSILIVGTILLTLLSISVYHRSPTSIVSDNEFEFAALSSSDQHNSFSKLVLRVLPSLQLQPNRHPHSFVLSSDKTTLSLHFHLFRGDLRPIEAGFSPMPAASSIPTFFTQLQREFQQRNRLDAVWVPQNHHQSAVTAAAASSPLRKMDSAEIARQIRYKTNNTFCFAAVNIWHDRLNLIRHSLITLNNTLAALGDVAYFVAAGSFLGSYRYHTAIPYDGDVDVRVDSRHVSRVITALRKMVAQPQHHMRFLDTRAQNGHMKLGVSCLYASGGANGHVEATVWTCDQQWDVFFFDSGSLPREVAASSAASSGSPPIGWWWRRSSAFARFTVSIPERSSRLPASVFFPVRLQPFFGLLLPMPSNFDVFLRRVVNFDQAKTFADTRREMAAATHVGGRDVKRWLAVNLAGGLGQITRLESMLAPNRPQGEVTPSLMTRASRRREGNSNLEFEEMSQSREEKCARAFYSRPNPFCLNEIPCAHLNHMYPYMLRARITIGTDTTNRNTGSAGAALFAWIADNMRLPRHTRHNLTKKTNAKEHAFIDTARHIRILAHFSVFKRRIVSVFIQIERLFDK